MVSKKKRNPVLRALAKKVARRAVESLPTYRTGYLVPRFERPSVFCREIDR